MKTLVVYYSLSGKTKKAARERATKEDGDILEVKKKKPYSNFTSYLFGAYAAMKQKTVEIESLNADFADYDKIILAAPIWAGFPAPPINSVIALLPAGKEVEFIFTSGGGGAGKSLEKVKSLIENQGCTFVGHADIKVGM